MIPEKKDSVVFGRFLFSAVVGHTVRIHTVSTISYSLYIRTNLAQKLRQFSDFRWLFLGHTKQSVQWTVGMKNEVRKRQDSGTILAWKMRQIFVGHIWCCEVFSLARNVVSLLICTFLKLNNKSLSLSLGFPTLGFSLAFA
jgi:hypothetical protein